MPNNNSAERADRFQTLITNLQKDGDTHTHLGTDILTDLWEI